MSAVEKLVNTLIEYAVNYGFQVAGAVIILVVGTLLANWVAGLLSGLLQKKKFDITLSKFLIGCTRILVLGFAILVALGKFGITIAPFVAALSALAFGASFAVQGPLSNYGAGLSIILTRPFVVGDTITVRGVSGLVKEVKLGCTILTSEDGVKITIPNKDVVGEVIHNSGKYKMAHGTIGIAYESSSETAVRVIQETLQRFPETCQDPKPQIGIQEFSDSAISVGYRFWIPTAKYYPIFYAVNSAIYKSLTEAGVKIPYPQRELRIISQTTNV